MLPVIAVAAAAKKMLHVSLPNIANTKIEPVTTLTAT
jgi:hypothetical protein